MNATVTGNGAGVVEGAGSSASFTTATKRCPDCAGLGEIFGYAHVEDGPMDVTVWPCGLCNATGYVPAEGRAA